MVKFQKLGIVLLIILGLTACTAGVTGSWVGTPRPNAIFQDDFSNPASGWETWNDPNGSFVAYQNGGLRILVKEKQFDYWSKPGKRFTDMKIEVDAIKLAGPNDNDFGLICRYQDRNNFYAFLISSDGYGGILKVEEGQYKVISGSQLIFSQSIHQGEALNHVQADCIGTSLVLYANGQMIAQAEDKGFIAGEMGLIAGSSSTAGVDIFFDNLVVSKP